MGNVWVFYFAIVTGLTTSTLGSYFEYVWFQEKPQNTFYMVGDNVTFNCTCCTNSSLTPPRVEFRHNGLKIQERLSSNQRVSVSLSNNSINGTIKNKSHSMQLQIKEITLSEMGVIACLCHNNATDEVILTTEALLMPKNVLSDIREADKNQTSTKGAVLWDPTNQSGKPAWNASVLIGQAFSKHNVSIERNGTEVHVSANRTIDRFDLGQRHYRFDWNFTLPERVNPRTVKATFLEDTHELFVTGYFYNLLSIEVE